MSSTKTSKLAVTPFADVLARCDFPPEVIAPFAGLAEPASLVAALRQAGLLLEASRVYAHALPKREAVWWACMCALHTAPPGLPELDRKARECAELWVRSQSDEQRRAAMEHARAVRMQSPDAWAGVAAFWSGDSLAPVNNPKVPPPPHLAGIAVAGAVALASVRGTPARQGQRLARFLDSGQDIAGGGQGRLEAEAA